MFIIQFFINERKIREIAVRNTGKQTTIGDYYYEIKEPKLAQNKIVHDRDKGDIVLAQKALKLVADQPHNKWREGE